MTALRSAAHSMQQLSAAEGDRAEGFRATPVTARMVPPATAAAPIFRFLAQLLC